MNREIAVLQKLQEALEPLGVQVEQVAIPGEAKQHFTGAITYIPVNLLIHVPVQADVERKNPVGFQSLEQDFSETRVVVEPGSSFVELELDEQTRARLGIALAGYPPILTEGSSSFCKVEPILEK